MRFSPHSPPNSRVAIRRSWRRWVPTPTPALLAAIAAAEPTHDATRRDLPTVRNVIRYDDTGGRVWDLINGEARFEALSVQPDDITDTALAAEGVLLSAMALHAQLDVASWLRARTAATIYFDPQEDYIAGNESDLLEAVRVCDVFLPGKIEALELANTSDPSKAAEALPETGPAHRRHQAR